MKKSLISVALFFTVAFNGFSQTTDIGVKHFLQNFLKNNPEKGELYFYPSLDTTIINNIIQSFPKNNSEIYPANYRYFNLPVYWFSKQEQDSIINTLNAQRGKLWDSSILESAKLLLKPRSIRYRKQGASMEEKIKYMEYSDSVRNEDKNKTFIHFSIPVFLRNSNVCFFLFGQFQYSR
jgi:hypothetical protein